MSSRDVNCKYVDEALPPGGCQHNSRHWAALPKTTWQTNTSSLSKMGRLPWYINAMVVKELKSGLLSCRHRHTAHYQTAASTVLSHVCLSQSNPPVNCVPPLTIKSQNDGFVFSHAQVASRLLLECTSAFT